MSTLICGLKPLQGNLKFRQKPKCLPVPDGSQDALSSSNARRARCVAGDGHYRKAIQALSSSGLAAPSLETLDIMKAKHPQCLPPTITSNPPSPPVQSTDDEVISALRSFPVNFAPGPSSLRANHLKEAVFCPSPILASRALNYLVDVVNVFAAGLAPPFISPYLCAASLLAPKKKDGGLHPIAVGEVLHCLTSKCVSRAVQSEAISPLQVGVSIPVGCESIVHSVSSLLSDPAISPDCKSCLFVDFSNAFNSVDHELMFQEVRSHIPSIAAWTEFSYGSQPFLFFGNFQLLSCTGVQQGDPLGPLFCAHSSSPD